MIPLIQSQDEGLEEKKSLTFPTKLLLPMVVHDKSLWQKINFDLRKFMSYFSFLNDLKSEIHVWHRTKIQSFTHMNKLFIMAKNHLETSVGCPRPLV